MDTMYEVLMKLPLFQGVSYIRLTEILSKTKFHFLKYPAGETLVEEKEPCSHLKFIISGAVRLTTSNYNGRFKILQTLNAPDVLAPQCLFGRRQEYPFSAVALKPAGVLQISKADYVSLLRSDDIFLYNFLNTLSISSQKAVNGMLSVTHGSLEERLAYWVVTLTQPQATDIVVSCKLRDFYSIYGVPRSMFIAALDRMQSAGLVTYDLNEVRFPNRPGLVEMLTDHPE